MPAAKKPSKETVVYSGKKPKKKVGSGKKIGLGGMSAKERDKLLDNILLHTAAKKDIPAKTKTRPINNAIDAIRWKNGRFRSSDKLVIPKMPPLRWYTLYAKK